MEEQMILPADVYDALEFAAEVEGGVGMATMLDKGCAVCGYGLAWLAGILEVPKKDQKTEEMIALALYTHSDKRSLPFTYAQSDNAVSKVINRRKLYSDDRIPFAAWAKELGLIRGE